MTTRSKNLLALLAAATTFLFIPTLSQAHVTWTQVNQLDPNAIAQYHLDDSVFATTSPLIVGSGFNNDRHLIIQAPTSGPGFSSVAGPESFFATALRLDGTQRADSLANFGYDNPSYVGPDLNGALPGDNNNGPDLVDKDLTIEFWIKWDDAPTSSSVEVGFRSGSKLRISRDTVNPANDEFGILATHGTYVEAPGFTDWVTVGDEEAPLNEWIHFAVAIDSTGSTYNSLTGHYEYNAGTVARFYLNAHAVGVAPHTVPLDGLLDFHSESSLLTIRNVSGVASLDEVAIWRVDLSEAGTALSPFSNGRGLGVSAVSNWEAFE